MTSLPGERDLRGRPRTIRQGRGRNVQRVALLALVSEIEGNALLQGLEKLVQGVAGGEAAGKLWNVCPVAAFLDVDAAVNSIAESPSLSG